MRKILKLLIVLGLSVAAGVAAFSVLGRSGAGEKSIKIAGAKKQRTSEANNATAPTRVLTAEERAQQGLPGYAKTNARVQEAYLQATMEPALLAEMNCYCGCEDLGHRSLRECFVRTVDGGKVEYDPHGAECQVCISEAVRAGQLLDEGRAVAEIKSIIDETYAAGLPTTATVGPP